MEDIFYLKSSIEVTSCIYFPLEKLRLIVINLKMLLLMSIDIII
jgi:hypothetical protein